MDHAYFMRRCLELAAKAAGRTSPNPMVGALLVADGKIIAEGFHKKAGGPHAEIEAIKNAGAALRVASGVCPLRDKQGLPTSVDGGKSSLARRRTPPRQAPKGNTILYVNLEPCCHTGRTGPCTEAILKAGIRHVVVGSLDPNPLMKGKGVKALKQRGVKVTVGVLKEECARFNEIHCKYIVSKRPFVILKIAATLDGMVATKDGDSQWITSPPARARVHQLRDRIDAILVGANTVVRDNPRLTTRLAGGWGRDPIRVIIDTHLYADPKAAVFDHATRKNPVYLATGFGGEEAPITRYRRRGVTVLFCKQLPDQHLDLDDLLRQLGERGITSLLVEGGAGVHSSFIEQKVADKMLLFLAPRLMGGMGLPMLSGLETRRLTQLPVLKDLSVERVGPDFMVSGYL